MVIVTVLDEATMSQDYRDRIIENRKYYARKQGMCNDGNLWNAFVLTSLDRLRDFLP